MSQWKASQAVRPVTGAHPRRRGGGDTSKLLLVEDFEFGGCFDIADGEGVVSGVMVINAVNSEKMVVIFRVDTKAEEAWLVSLVFFLFDFEESCSKSIFVHGGNAM